MSVMPLMSIPGHRTKRSPQLAVGTWTMRIAALRGPRPA